MKTITHNDLGKKYLVENCQKIRIDTLVKKTKKDLLTSILQAQIEAGGFTVNVTTNTLHHGGKRFWFECPVCKLPCGIIYKHPINNQVGCRTCLNLEYRARQYKGMVENSI